jgi:TolB-like protein
MLAKPMRVFISHSSQDRERADEICRLLEKRGIRCWIAPRDVRPGFAYGAEIIDAIDATTAMVLVLSQHSNASVHVTHEVERAVRKRKAIIPFLIEDVEPAKGLAFFIGTTHQIDAWKPPLDPYVEQLAQAIRSLADPEASSIAESVAGNARADAPPTPRHRRPIWFALGLGGAALAITLATVILLAVKSEKKAGGPGAAIESGGVKTGRASPAHTRAEAPHDVNRIAVLEFENQRKNDSENDWYCKALQAAFNTELSKLPQLSVVAPEIIERTVREADRDRMVVAQQLGVRRFITGSFAVLGETIRIDARVVETTNGTQEIAANVEGKRDGFFDLQKALALETLEHFRVRLTQAQEASLTKTSRVSPDKYRMLLQAEGVTKVERKDPVGSTEPHARRAPGTHPDCDHRLSWCAALGLASVAAAQTATEGTEELARQLLESYRRAQEEGNLDQIAALHVSFSESRRKAIQAYLVNIEDLRVRFTGVQVQPHGQDLAVSYTRVDEFVDKETGEDLSLEVRVTKFLVRDGGGWKFVEAEE